MKSKRTVFITLLVLLICSYSGFCENHLNGNEIVLLEEVIKKIEKDPEYVPTEKEIQLMGIQTKKYVTESEKDLDTSKNLLKNIESEGILIKDFTDLNDKIRLHELTNISVEKIKELKNEVHSFKGKSSGSELWKTFSIHLDMTMFVLEESKLSDEDFKSQYDSLLKKVNEFNLSYPNHSEAVEMKKEFLESVKTSRINRRERENSLKIISDSTNPLKEEDFKFLLSTVGKQFSESRDNLDQFGKIDAAREDFYNLSEKLRVTTENLVDKKEFQKFRAEVDDFLIKYKSQIMAPSYEVHFEVLLLTLEEPELNESDFTKRVIEISNSIDGNIVKYPEHSHILQRNKESLQYIMSSRSQRKIDKVNAADNYYHEAFSIYHLEKQIYSGNDEYIYKALDLLSKAKSIKPFELKYYVLNGDIYQELGEYSKSEKEYLEAIKIDKDNTILLTALGYMYLDWGNEEEADRIFKKVLEIEPENQYVPDWSVITLSAYEKIFEKIITNPNVINTWEFEKDFKNYSRDFSSRRN